MNGQRSPSPRSVADAIANYLVALEGELRSIVTSCHPAMDPLYGMMRYHMGWTDAHFRPTARETGKRLRPLLCLLVCEACGAPWQRALPAAAALELLHNFSLIHDDVEDESLERRGRRTVWANWGIAQAINTGDAMYSMSFLALQRLLSSGDSGSTVSQAYALLARTALVLCQGQYLDLDFEKRLRVDLPQYTDMIERKTATLIACATETGALLGGASGQRRECFRVYGLELGLAFQVVDDILGIWGDPQVTGKPARDDLQRRKKTLPVVWALKQEDGDPNGLGDILADPSPLDGAALDRALEILDSLGARGFARATAEEHRARALSALSDTHIEHPAIGLLHHLATVATDRER